MVYLFMVSVFFLLAGIQFSARRLHLRKLSTEAFPGVDPLLFDSWKLAEKRWVTRLLWVTWIALALVFLLAWGSTLLSPSDISSLINGFGLMVLAPLLAAVSLAVVAWIGEGSLQKRLRLEAQVKSFYHPPLAVSDTTCWVAAQAHPASVRVTHVVGRTSTSGGFMSHTTYHTKTYRFVDGLSFFSPARVPIVAGKVNLAESVFLTCQQCGAKVAAHADHALWVKFPPLVPAEHPELYRRLVRFIMTHGSWVWVMIFFWIAFPSAFVCGFSLGHRLGAGRTTLISFAADILLLAFFVLLADLHVRRSIRRKSTMLKVIAMTPQTIAILEDPAASPRTCLVSVEIESIGAHEHELVLANSNSRENSGRSSLTIAAFSYKDFGFDGAYVPAVE